MWHHHGSDTPTSPGAILLHSSLMGIDIWITLLGIKPVMCLWEIITLSDLPKLWTTLSKISKFWDSKSFFGVYNWSKLSKKNSLKNIWLKCLDSEISVLHDFSFIKVSWIHKTYLMELQLFCWRHFSKTDVVQNTDLRIQTF